MMHWMIVDISNILFRVWAAQGGKSIEAEHLGLAMHSSFVSVRKWFNKVKPDKLVFAFEGKHNWRKVYTAGQTISGVGYKSNRIKDPAMETLYSMIDDFKSLVDQHSAIACLAVDGCEGDDVIAGFVQLYAGEECKITVLSGDKDFMQLLKHPNVQLIDPATGLDRAIDKKTGKLIDPEYFIFEKCFRGDAGDSVASAYPRLRETKIRQAYENESARINLMNEMIEGPNGTYRVGDAFNENKLLMDLECQPDEIKARMYTEIAKEVADSGSYSHFHFLKFLGKYKLQVIADSLTTFQDMFSANAKQQKINGLLIE